MTASIIRIGIDINKHEYPDIGFGDGATAPPEERERRGRPAAWMFRSTAAPPVKRCGGSLRSAGIKDGGAIARLDSLWVPFRDRAYPPSPFGKSVLGESSNIRHCGVKASPPEQRRAADAIAKQNRTDKGGRPRIRSRTNE